LATQKSKANPAQPGDPGKSLTAEVELLRGQVADLCTVVKQLVKLQSITNQKLDAALKGGVGADCAVI
jgi:hypothetical protein